MKKLLYNQYVYAGNRYRGFGVAILCIEFMHIFAFFDPLYPETMFMLGINNNIPRAAVIGLFMELLSVGLGMWLLQLGKRRRSDYCYSTIIDSKNETVDTRFRIIGIVLSCAILTSSIMGVISQVDVIYKDGYGIPYKDSLLGIDYYFPRIPNYFDEIGYFICSILFFVSSLMIFIFFIRDFGKRKTPLFQSSFILLGIQSLYSLIPWFFSYYTNNKDSLDKWDLIYKYWDLLFYLFLAGLAFFAAYPPNSKKTRLFFFCLLSVPVASTSIWLFASYVKLSIDYSFDYDIFQGLLINLRYLFLLFLIWLICFKYYKNYRVDYELVKNVILFNKDKGNTDKELFNEETRITERKRITDQTTDTSLVENDKEETAQSSVNPSAFLETGNNAEASEGLASCNEETIETKEKTDEIKSVKESKSDVSAPKAMFCRKCGAKLIEGSLFCNKCGTSIINIDN